MANKTAMPRQKNSENFRLKPLVACVRLAVTGGMLVGNAIPAHAELPIAAATWISSGSASSQIIGNTLRIDQQTDKAVMNWQSFNVGKENTVQFVQPNSSSIALNRIGQQDASRIMGQIIANGQVYLYNKNGFIFDKDSVVNANSFMASTLNITDDVFERGITRVFSENGTAALAIEPMTAGDKLDPKTAQILIEAGAKIHTDKGGRIIIAAPNIENRGSLSAGEQGQIIVAASQDKVYLKPSPNDVNNPFAGLLVEVGTGGKVTNTGDIAVRQGNVTLAGFAVNQQGRVSATTSVNVNGSIRLVAQEGVDENNKDKLFANKTQRDTDLGDELGTEATVKLGGGSVTQILADTGGGQAIDEQEQPDSYLQITANTVRAEAGSTIKVPGGKVDIKATDNLLQATQGTKGRIFIDSTALIDVAGYKGVAVDMERNVGEISVQSYELRDAPLQRDGVLKGKTIRVDLRKGTDMVDTSGAQARISRGIEERLSKGGQINLTASDDIIANDGSVFDIAGGTVQYRDGYISSTKLVTDYGRIVDISEADPNERYTGIFGVVEEVHTKWGVKKVWNILDQFGLGQFQRGYTEGKAAGSLNIVAPKLAWDGLVNAGSTLGIYQRDAAAVPAGGSFNIDMAVFQSLQNVRFTRESDHIALADNFIFPMAEEKQPGLDLKLSRRLFTDTGLGSVSVSTLGNAALESDADITMRAGGKLSVAAGSVAVDGRFQVAGGSLSLTSAADAATAPSSGDGSLTIASQAVLDVSGLWVNDLRLGVDVSPNDPLILDGGTVTLKSRGDLHFNAGASIRADGGAWLPLDGELRAGKGGSITLAALGAKDSDGNITEPASLTFAGQVSAYGLEQNGKLALASSKIIVGTPTGEDDTADALLLSVRNGNFDFSQQLAFSEIQLSANYGRLTVKSDAHLNLRQQNLELTSAYLNAPTGQSMRGFSNIAELPEHLRQPLKLGLSGNAGAILETGSRIVADKGSEITIASQQGSIFADGWLQADAGKIDISIVPSNGLEYDASQTIWIGQRASLLVQGSSRLQPADQFGRVAGEVLDGGTINFDAQRGVVVLAEGSMLDVSGNRVSVDIQKVGGGSAVEYVRQTLASNAGKITIRAAEGIVIDGEMRAVAGAVGARAGSLSLSLDRSKRNTPLLPTIPFPTGTLTINVVQGARRGMDEEFSFGDDFTDSTIGRATLSADRFAQAGFSDLSLFSRGGNVTFVGDVNLSAAERIAIDVAEFKAAGMDGAAAGNVVLAANYLELGSSLNRSIATTAEAGDGEFSANAQWIQLEGASRWSGFSKVALNSQHDIRTLGLHNEPEERDYVGALVTAADLYLHASQIYPTTLTDFTFAVRNNDTGRIVVTGRNSDVSPLAAAGSLTLEAPFIDQQGVLKAPLGTINLNAGQRLTLADGSVTSVSAAGLLIPLGVTQGGLDWLYPLDKLTNLVFDNAPVTTDSSAVENSAFKGTPEKRVKLSAVEIEMAPGSVVDLSGGGDLQAYEFIAGSGGSNDYLQTGGAGYQGGFAIIPTLGTQWAPYDHYENTGWTYAPGATVHLDGTGNLPAGEYAILPAHYALLPGAYLVTPQAGTQDQSITQYTVDGRAIVSGYMAQAGSEVRDARSSGFLIETGADVRRHAEYKIYTANAFYTEKAAKSESAVPILPMDGGHISLVAQTRLIMEGQFMIDALSGGKGARMDIAANRIVVADHFSEIPTEGILEILAGDLTALNVDSLLLGGARQRNLKTGETDIQVTSDQVIFSAGISLEGAELMAVAKDVVAVEADASLAANRIAATGDSVINISGDGAMLRLSGGSQVSLNRTDSNGSAGDLKVAAGARLHALESMLLDASHATELLGDIDMQGGSLNLGANAINLGEVDGLTGNALNLSNAKLTRLSVDELVLTARDSLAFYGNVGQVDANGELIVEADNLPKALQFSKLSINAAGLSGFGVGGDTARLRIGSLQLQNTAEAESVQTADGLGRLQLLADSVEIGDGKFTLQGFDTVDIQARDQFRSTGDGDLRIAADLNLATAAFTADGGSKLRLDATGGQARFASLNSELAPTSGFGGSVDIVADAIDFNTKVLLPSGRLGLHALSGDVTLGGEARVDLAGRTVQFGDINRYTAGGSFKAVADQGRIATGAGSLIDVASSGDADGGSISLQALQQTVSLQGELKAQGASAALEADHYAQGNDFDTLMRALNTAGADQSIYFRVRHADIRQSNQSLIAAEQVSLVSDTGTVELAGSVNADGAAHGGKIKLYAGDKLVLANGAVLSAQGIGEGAAGGTVLLSAVDGDNDGIGGIEVQRGSSIDVSGKGAANGEVTLRARRTADGGVDILPIAGDIKGASAIYAEGVAKYGNADLGDDGNIDTADIAKIKAETDAYMAAANMSAVTETLGYGIRLLAGVEIDYSGDLVLKDTWDLADWRYDENNDGNVWDDLPGRLVIRTDGHLTLDQSLTDGFKNENFEYNDNGVVKSVAVIDRLQKGASWSYQLTAGGDLQSADPNKTLSAKNLTLASNVRLRTGSGDIEVNAGADIILASGQKISNKVVSAAAKGSSTLAVADISAWKVGGYLSGSTAIATGAYITEVDPTSVTHTTKEAAILKSFSLRIDSDEADGWRVGDYLSGNGIDTGTTITKINTAGFASLTASATAKNNKNIKVADVSGWVVGDYLTGNGVAAGSVITAINALTKTVTLNKAVTAAVPVNTTLKTLPSVQLSKALSKAISQNVAIKTLPVVELSQALTTQVNANITLTAEYTAASIYSAGTTSQSNPYGSLSDKAVARQLYADYPVNGGDLSLNAGGNIRGTVGTNDFNDWLLRRGEWSDAAHTEPTAWGVALGYLPGKLSSGQKTDQYGRAPMPQFQQSIGSFGGGKVSISAGGDIIDLDVAMPTTGKQVGDANGSNNFSGFKTNQVEINGGGTMQISAGGDIIGGSYFLGQGNGAIKAGGSVKGGTNTDNGPILLLGDSRFSISATGDVGLGGVSDPMITHKDGVNFFSYSAASALNVASLAGDVLLFSNGRVFADGNTFKETLSAIYPASLNASAFGGDIKLGNEITLFPSASGQLNLLAEQNISADKGDLGVRLGMSDADATLLPGAESPLTETGLGDILRYFDTFNATKDRMEDIHAATPIHRGDAEPARLVTRQGNIENIGFTLPKKALIKSGNDITNLLLYLQHANDDDVTLLEAARDISYPLVRLASTGKLDNSSSREIEIGGPGDVLVKTGRHMDLGGSKGISTAGDLINSALPDHGANLTVLTGANGELDYAGFIRTYLQDKSEYAEAWQKANLLITGFMRERLNDANLSDSAALEAFAKLNSGDFVAIQPQLNAIVLPVFFNEIKVSGSASAGTSSLGNEGGFAAIESLFPGSDWKGDISVFFSKIHTKDGGDINLLAPGGQINAGVAFSFDESEKKKASELGIVAQKDGNINVVLRDDFLVNTSRVFALDGGDIMIWSSEGDIDAGRGAKSAIAAPPPEIGYDEKGNMTITFPAVVSGSGIRTAASSAGVVAGDVYLFAPKGVVDAGEAGIGGTNVTISATAVLGAQNIQVSGVGTGVPVAATGSVAAGLTGTSNMTAGVSQMAESSVGGNVGKDASKAMAKAVLGILNVEILGFGD
ncbi:filamentous hemagglutinin family protein [Methylomonas montana]|uniref:filamentous haemagglutinin family protein n=1 Tax=Methylomonas montana TaxID=3058963 RepID=UPI00265A8689|nr:filamentous haemagglutinin family protein [Methylomonas montana]WKJ89049.1 filamentous hemagglutinin family protein [Methylomonas montana]